MNDTSNKEMESLRKLIDLESNVALERFQRRDFQALLAKKLQEKMRFRKLPWFCHPAYLASGLTLALVLAVLIAVIPPYLELKRDLRELKEILMRVPEMRAPIPAPYPSVADEETKRFILLSWIFKQAEYRLNLREVSAAEWRLRMQRGIAPANPEMIAETRFPKLSEKELLFLEKRIQAWIAEGKRQRLFKRNKTNHL